ncbi:nitroreductase family protein [Aerococcus sp. HMSC10H05]|uniref:nitroreductase family protein n=1 Tax=Aerococcus sp. HMSC10H05 TaxID=1581084 RepID=UPI0008A4F4E6|nr:nitroreductase family protein [Aerococcus sp. HMSC10H05]OFU52020.1 nitroreductase [Aerococcus sp. HMSC10H05]
MSDFKDLLTKRRSQYAIGANTDVTAADVTAALNEVIPQVPSAFNSQATRVVVVSGENNVKLWELVKNVQKDVLDEATLNYMTPIMDGARDAVGTILFFEDRDAVESGIPANEERRLIYKNHASANAQLTTWLTLTELGLGANLQHFNIGYEQGFDRSIRELLDLSESWELIAQMPFGSIEAPAADKETIASSELVIER